ncbi:hypothetical protein F5877DRAFT_85836 [Lentinula edodes]|nr:hypothetical protein F5877DRAFT_85836 [Lentinula edodes]
MTTSHTTTTTQPTASTSSCPADPPRPGTSIDEDEDEILREALARVERVKAQKAAEEAEEGGRCSGERSKKEGGAGGARSGQSGSTTECGGRGAARATSRGHHGKKSSEGERKRKRGSSRAVGGDPDDGDDDNDEEEREPCERCKAKKIPCLQQAGKWSSVICKPCHDSKVQCSFSGRPLTGKREGRSGKRMAIMESQMAQNLADLRALWEANSKTHQYLHQLLRQEEDHAHLITMETGMAMMGMGEGPATAGPSRRATKQWRPLKRQRIVEESKEEEEEEEEEKEVEEKEKEVEKDGEGEEDMARSEKGKERAE